MTLASFCSLSAWANRWTRLKEKIEKKPSDVAALVFVVSLTSISYFYGMLCVTRAFIAQSDYSPIAKFFLLVTPTWIVYGILGNVYYIHKRNSFALKLLPVPFQPADPPINAQGYARCAYAPIERRILDDAGAYGYDLNPSEFAEALGMDTKCHLETVREPQVVIDPKKWHSCNICKIKVPPRSWHCLTCKHCILRRDHHCTFAMGCVGQENQANFIGFLLYMSLGATYAFFVGALYRKEFVDGTPIWLTTVKTMSMIYPYVLEFGFHNILVNILLGFAMITFGYFFNYFHLATEGQTAYDAKNRIVVVEDQPKSRYTRLEEFLGSNPILRILIPFFPRPKITYEYKSPWPEPSSTTISCHFPKKNEVNNSLNQYTLGDGHC